MKDTITDRPPGLDAEQWQRCLGYTETMAALFTDFSTGTASLIADPTATATSQSSDAGTVVLFSPHPDDEAITGALPLRLARENGVRIVNIAVTAGSDPGRRQARLAELDAACQVLGFLTDTPEDGPFATLRPGEWDQDQQTWQEKCHRLVALLRKWRPRAVFYPHSQDRHPTHEAVSQLAAAALIEYSAQDPKKIFAVETECWRPMAAPNLLVGLSPRDTAWLTAALAQHRGEVERNPYHAFLAPRLIDAVRRGSELIKGPGSGRAAFTFGELYRINLVAAGMERPWSKKKAILPPEEPASLDLFTT